MGVLFDYFRAADADSAAVVDAPGWSGPLVPGDGGEMFDGVDAKGIDPDVMLGQLVAFVQGVPWSPDIVDSQLVSPAPDTATGEEEHGVFQLADTVRDSLAGVAAEQIPELAARWVEIEEFGGYAVAEDLAGLVADLGSLARRAQAVGEHLFCWWSL